MYSRKRQNTSYPSINSSGEVIKPKLNPVKKLTALEEHHKNIERILNTLLFIVCFLFLTAHIMFTCGQYLTYAVTAQVTVEYDEFFDPPAVSYCFTFVNSRDTEAFPPGDPCRGVFTYVRNPTMYVSCLTQIKKNRWNMFKSLMDIQKTIISISLKSHNESSKTVTIKEKEKLDPLINRFIFRTSWNCIRVQFPTEAIKSRLRMNMVKEYTPTDDMGRFMTIDGIRTMFNEFKAGNFSADAVLVIIHEPETFPRGYWEQVLFSQFTSTFEKKSYTFQITRTKYLPAPFFSKCTDLYKADIDHLDEVRAKKDRIESQAHCIEKCLIGRMNKLAGKKMLPPFETFTDEKEMEGGSINDSLSKVVMAKYYDNCHKSCPYECNTMIYAPVLSQNARDLPTKYEISVMNRNPTMSVEFNPKLSFYEFLIYIASVGGLWFGFNAFQFITITSPYLLKFLKFISHQHHKTINNVQVNVTNNLFQGPERVRRLDQKRNTIRVSPEERYSFSRFD